MKAITPARVADGGFSANPFAAVATAMVRNGWSIFPQQTAGDRRTPGRLHGRTIRWKEDHDLANTPPTVEFIRDCVTQCPDHNVANVFGPASGNTLAVDIDVLDPAMSAVVVELAEEHLGATPFRRIGHAPKIALFYRHSPDDIVPSTSKHIADQEGKESPHGLEILSAGKLITIHGRHHKTGRFFQWVGDANPITDGPSHAPEVSSEQVRDFLDAVGNRLPFTKPTRFHDAAWEPSDRAEGIRVPRIVREPGAPKLADGREDYLRDLVWRTCKAHGHDIVGADDGARALTIAIAQAVAEAFAENAVTDGRWAPAALRKTVLGRVASLVAKYFSGDVKPKVGVGADGRELPTIEIRVGDIADAVSRSETALVASTHKVYQRGGEIVTLGENPVMTSSGKEIAAQRIFPVNEHALLELVSTSARYVKWNPKKNEDVLCSPPMWIATHLTARRGRLSLPVLTGVMSAPTLRPDGSVLDIEGYDEATGLLFDARGMKFPKVPEKPTREQGEAALRKLEGLTATFPFVSEADRSVATACQLTAVVRRSLRTALMFGFSATAPGSGKSLLVDVASVLATGREAGVIAQGKTAEEDEKRLGSVLLGGDPVISIDNCETAVGSDLLCQMLTQTSVKVRILGRSEAPELPTSALVCATGQSLVFYGDMTRRALLCRLDAGCERPELREFKTDPVEEAKKHRAEFVVAALTVLRAYHVAGRPPQTKPLGSFGEWSRLVRDALVWLGRADPCQTMEEARSLDPKLETLTTVVSHWRDVIGGEKVTVRELIDLVSQNSLVGGRVTWAHPDLREALLVAAGDGGYVASKRLGKWLLAHVGRIVAGCQVERAGTSSGTAVWRLKYEGSDTPTLAAPMQQAAPLPEAVRTYPAAVRQARSGAEHPLSPEGKMRRNLTTADKKKLVAAKPAFRAFPPCQSAR